MLFAFLIWVLVELALMVLVAKLIGVFWMLVLLVATWPIGLSIIRRQGRAAMTRLNAAIDAGRTPTAEVIEGALAIFAGVLLMIPGFLTDIVAVILLVGPSRRLVGKGVARSRRVTWLHRGAGWVGSAGTAFGGRARQSYDAESTAHDVNDRQIGQDNKL
jgi:UPF0716 protein FxsA